MKLSLGDKLALIYTSAGSQRNVAGITGLSHQQVGRILRRNLEGGDLSRWENDPEIVQAVNVAFDIHKDLARGVAKRHGIPFTPAVPVYMERLPLKLQAVYVGDKQIFRGTPKECADYIRGKRVTKVDEMTGEIRGVYQIDPKDQPRAERKRLLGQRAAVQHMHWLPDRVRQKMLIEQVKTNRFFAASASSKVNLRRYNKQAEERNAERERGGLRRTKSRVIGQLDIKGLLKDGVKIERINTPMVAMQNKGGYPELNALSLMQTIQDRHAPATGEAGTTLADQMIYQLDNREDKEANAKPKGKARGNKRPRR